MSAVVWLMIASQILCMAFAYGKLYLWDRPRRRARQVQPDQVRPKIQAEPTGAPRP